MGHEPTSEFLAANEGKLAPPAVLFRQSGEAQGRCVIVPNFFFHKHQTGAQLC